MSSNHKSFLTICILAPKINQKMLACLKSCDGLGDIFVISKNGQISKTQEKKAKDILSKSKIHFLKFSIQSKDYDESGEVYGKKPAEMQKGGDGDHDITNFSEIRNWALSQIESEWTFFIDSDEILNCPPQLVFETLKNASTNVSGINIRRSDVFLGKVIKHTEAGNQKLLRILKTNQCTFKGKVHEVAECSGEIIDSRIAILHDSHESVDEFINKIVYYSKLRSLELNLKTAELIMQLIFYPPAKWLKNMILLKGWRDGWRGVAYASIMSLHSLLVRLFALEKRVSKKT